jgi:molybdenum cofactor guanylyltransferase
MGNCVSIKTIVLAGGMSRRMGQDKARIKISGVPLLTKVCTLGCTLGLAIHNSVHVVAGIDRDYSDLLPQGCEFVIDHVLEGPLVALVNAMETLAPQPPNLGEDHQASWVLVLACDLPNLSVATVQAWVEQLDALPGETIAYLPKSEQGWEPLCGFYRMNAIESLHFFVNSGGRSFQKWLSQGAVLPFVRELEWDDRSVFLNCNTPGDFPSAGSDLLTNL